jgi:threonine dehydrogenase-like Zn-dependent dehydrogenase
MKALRLVRPRNFEWIEAPQPCLPNDGDEWLLVKTRWVSLCGSDISFYNGNKRYINYPFAPGIPNHENVGQVMESQSAQFLPGDVVLSIPEGDMGLAEYYLARVSKVIHLPDALADKDDSCLIQPLSRVLNAIDRLGEFQEKSIAVIGLGSIGLFFCWLLRKMGAGNILGIDPYPYRCQAAEKLGADRALAMRSVEFLHAARQEHAEWRPIDICIEAVGHQTETINDCLELVRKGGTVVAFGVPDQHVYPIEYETFFRKNANLLAVVTPDWADTMTRASELYVTSRKELDWMVTHRLPIKEAARAFKLYERHEDKILKVILQAGMWE